MSKNTRRIRKRDEGFTMVELLISVTVSGLIMAVVASAVSVVLRQSDNTSGRLNNARSEQSVGQWMPADLSSAQRVDTSPNANPCAPDTCPPEGLVVGSNALLLEWIIPESDGLTIIDRTTRVAYIYAEVGDEFQLVRVECSSPAGGAWACSRAVILHDLDEPPVNVEWVPGQTVPSWVIVVSEPLDPLATSESADPVTDPGYSSKNAQRVVVTINGGGDAPGAGGGLNQISVSAGGTDRKALDTGSLLGAPTFTAARSRCGGRIALIVDESGSIGSTAIVQVRDAIRSFVQTFAGTPVQLEVVRFDTVSSVLGATGWARWFNMLDSDDVTALDTAIGQLRSNGGTNWEDAWFRTFFNTDGTVQSNLPDLVVFFTDGVPTYSRLNQSSATAPTSPPTAQGFSLATGSSYNQEAWYRANYIVQQFRSSVRLIGVGIGPNITSTSTWYAAPIVYERGYHGTYERYGKWYERSNKLRFQRSNRLIYEQLVATTWTARTITQYNADNTVPGESDGWRTRVGSGTPTWTTYSTTEAQYWASNTTAGSSDGWRTSVSSTKSVTWSETTAAAYNGSNTTTNESDGWRTAGTTGWNVTTAAVYTANNTTAGESDGWRSTAIYSAPYDTWEVVPKSVYDSTPSAGRRTNTASIAQQTPNNTIIARLVAGDDFGVAALPSPSGGYLNSAEANMYISPNWSDFAGALQAVALAECGGTLTLRTTVGGSAAPDPFTYQNSSLTDPNGSPIAAELKVVSTTAQFVSGTLDFAIPDGQYVTVEIQPQNLSDLVGYTPDGWVCTAGVTSRSFTTVPIAGSSWTGIRVQVGANEAVSCVQRVLQVST